MRHETELAKLMKRLVTAVMIFICGVAGYQFALFVINLGWWPSMSQVHPIETSVFIVLLSAVCGFIIAPLFWWALTKFGQFFETKIQNVSVSDLIAAIVGLLLGLLLANLIAIPLAKLPGSIGVYIAVLLNVALGYWGLRFFAKRGDDFRNLLNIGFKSKRARGKKPGREADEEESVDSDITEASFSYPKVLDTSAIIDARILDVAQTGFLEGTIILPRFILTELQGVADSADSQRRTRGRRGLSVVSELQKVRGLTVEIPETSLKDLGRDKVDEALVVLARRLKGKVITTDYNLNQVAQIEGVDVLNVNDLANSLKPMLLPGDKVEIDVIRLGKDSHQGIGYLDDGTMLVVEDGSRYVGERVKVTVTSMLQTSAGRMVFGRVHL